MGNRIRIIMACVAILLASQGAKAQRWAVQTNFMDYLSYGTLNIEGGIAVGRHWSANAVAKLNPYKLSKGGEPASARQMLYGAGVRYWPWHVYSGWWAGTRLQFQEYNIGGIKDESTTEGDRYGMGLSGGYSYMITPHLNVDIGAGFWVGWDKFTTYSCPVCGIKTDKGTKKFFLPNDLMLALVYVF